MIRRHITALRLLFMTVDGLSSVGLFAAISIARFRTTDWLGVWTAVGVNGWVLAAAYGLAWVVATWLLGLYRLRVRWSIRSELVDLVRADVLVAVATFTVLFLFKLPIVSRLFLIELFLAQIVLSVAVRAAVRLIFGWARSHGRNTRWVLVVGSGPAAEAFADRLERHVELGLRVVGHLSMSEEQTGPGSPTRPVLGSVDDIATILHEQVIDEVAICIPTPNLRLVVLIASLCQAEGRIVRIPLDELGPALPGGRVEDLDGMPILSLVYGSDRAIGLVLKRFLDIAIASVALIVLSPVLLIAAVWLRVKEGPPVLFSQVRVGLHGRHFRIYKFRTMVPDAEERYAEVAALSDTKGAAFKMKDDPRVTRFGRTLRTTSIDELPQLWNVIRGEMSIVGPRPAPLREVAEYDIWHRRRLSMKPGITGLWQVESRLDEEFDARAALDLAYIDRWSLWLDLKIILRTVPAMLQGR